MKLPAAIWLTLFSAGAPALDDDAAENFAVSPSRTIAFTTSEGTRMNPDVSPDGIAIVFDLLGDLYVLDIEGGKARALTRGPAVDYRPRYSPKGERIVFVSDRNGTDNLWVINSDGSGAQMVSEQHPIQRPKDARFFITPSWTPDGRYVGAAVTSEVTFYGADDIRLYPVDRESSEASVSVTKPPPLDPETRPISTARRPPFPREGVDPEFSADGRYMYYSLRTNLTRFDDDKLMPQYQVGQFDRLTGQEHTLTDAAQGAFAPRLSPDGRWLVYAVRYDADTGLRLRDLVDGTEKWLVLPVDRDAVENWWTEGLVNAYSFLPDSSALVTSFDGKLWRVPVPDGDPVAIPFEVDVRMELGPLQRPVQHVVRGESVRVRHLSDFALSPDGRQLAFRALGRIWVMQWPDGVPKRLTADSAQLDEESGPVWTDGGTHILFSGFSMARQEGHIYEVQWNARDRTPRALTTAPGFYPSLALTPDKRSLVALRAPVTRDALYNGYRQADLVRIDRGGGDPVPIAPVSFEGGSSLEGRMAPDLQFLAGDSTRVFFFDNSSAALVSIDLDDGERHEHVRIRGIGAATGTGANPKVDVRSAVLHPGGTALVVQHDATAFGQIDWIELAAKDLQSNRQPKIVAVTGSRSDGGKVAAVHRLTSRMGGLSPFWAHDQSALFYAVADRLFRVSADVLEPPGEPFARIALALRSPKTSGSLVFRNARLLTMDPGTELAAGDLLVEEGLIRVLGPPGIEVPAGTREIDLNGQTIMPGLISAHSHNSEVGEIAPLLAKSWPLHAKLAYGVTTVFDPASPMELYTLADLVNAGDFAGPRIFQTGPILTWNEQLDSAEDAHELVRRSDMYGDCCVKLYDIGSRLNRQWMVNAVAAIGQIPVPETEGSLNASLSYVLDGIPHLAHGLQMPVYDDVRQLLGRSGSSIDYQFTTLVGNGGPSAWFYYFDHALDESDSQVRHWIPYEYFQRSNRRRLTIPAIEQVFPMYAENLARLMDAGMSVHLGEHGIAHGLANHWNIWALASGAGNRRALEAATLHGARALGLERQLGSLQPGKIADLIVVDGNPLEDIRATINIRYVMRGGELYDPATLARVWPEPAPEPVRWWAEDEPEWRPGKQPSGGVDRR